MKRKLLLCFTILPLLAAGLAGCSRDEDKETHDGAIVERSTGVKVRVYEVKSYPDFVHVWGLENKIPCKPIKKDEIPSWLYDVIIEMGAYDIYCYLFIGELLDNSEKMCFIWGPAQSSMFNYVYYFGSTEKRYLVKNYQDFWYSTTNWKCVYIVEHELVK